MSFVLTPDKFDEQTKAYVARQCSEIPLQGMLMGAIDADALWNVKPLILIDGVMHVVRFSDPQIDPALKAEMLETYEVSKNLTKRPVLVNSGSCSMGLWVCRRFCQVSIAERLQSKNLGEEMLWYRWMFQLIQQLMHLHRHDCFHGHITPDNVMIDNDAVYLVDADCSVRSLQQRRQPLCWAPELMIANTELQRSIDVYGLSLVLEPIAKRLKWKDLFGLVSEMQSAHPNVRPSIDEVMRRFERFCRMTFEENQLEEPSGQQQLDTLQWLKGTQTLSADLVRNIQQAVQDQKKPARLDYEKPLADLAEKASVSKILFVLAIFAVGLWWFRTSTPESGQGFSTHQYRTLWQSGVRSRMQEVALAAVRDDDEKARMLIVEDTLQGEARPGVQSQFLKFVFGQAWEQDLTQQDRIFALKLGLGPLIGKQVDVARPLEDAHPAIVLATIGGIASGNLPKAVAEISVQVMYGLPQPYRGAFELLNSLGFQTFEYETSHALARLFYRGFNAADFESYVKANSASNGASRLLALAIALFSKDEQFPEAAWRIVSSPDTTFGELVAWFDQNPVVDWKTIPTMTKLYILAGIPWPQGLAFDLVADLLRHPLESVCDLAAQRLHENVLKNDPIETLVFIHTTALKIERADVVLLITALVAPEEMKQALVSKWFSRAPAPELVVGLLGTRSAVSGLDPFSVEAARYLRTKSWQVSLEQLQHLLLHRDPLVRVLAYSRLNPTNPVHRELLTAASKVETNDRILNELKMKLEEASAH
ncbi:MAG: protein kinase family protein [Bdellovibrionales bacterium]|nr:protein kinase family protein [Bdellovibrionales bacterium]